MSMAEAYSGKSFSVNSLLLTVIYERPRDAGNAF